ncbi:hypothetical protein GCM10022234_12380 [Aeromicrobium panaciterrae]|uniref:hypothetical protein n=1 Tax=Aeromicrobium panaciterrae TaxID=363861 RepID=UPI0031CDB51F
MDEDVKTLWVPLRSNAHSLLAGAPIQGLRRRLKQAAISYDEVLLESGGLSITAGPSGRIEMPLPDEGSLAFQTAHQRHVARGQRFHLSLGTEDVQGVAANEMRTFINSETSIIWVPTLQPFARELPPSVDWMKYVTSPVTNSIKKTTDDWRRRDERNDALRELLPESFVRGAVIGHADRDLAVAAHVGVSVMQDSRHRAVLGSRFADSDWHATGFALPLLIPDVGELDWEAVATIRSHRAMKDFRRILQEIEQMTLEQSRDGDVETAVRHAMEKHLVKATGKVESLGAIPKAATVEFGAGIMLGVATVGLGGPAALVGGAALGSVVAGMQTAIGVGRTRRNKGWVSVYGELLDNTGPL